MLKQKLSQKMLQKLSPQQIQLMKLLQIPTANIEERIKDELEANPALDEGPDDEAQGYEVSEESEPEASRETESQEQFDMDDYIADYIEDDPQSYRMYNQVDKSDTQTATIPIALPTTFHEYLETQLGLQDIDDEKQLKIAHQIIGSIDEDGYLRRQPEAIVDDLLFQYNIDTTKQEVKQMLEVVQRFDPAGVGASDLQECLLIQIERKLKREAALNGDGDPSKRLARRILSEFFDEFSKKHYNKLEKYLEVSDEELRSAIAEILKLNPKPASAYTTAADTQVTYLVPDFTIHNRDGELELTINSRNIPDLRISADYVDMLRDYQSRKKQNVTNREDKQAMMFIKQKIDSAKWFIDALRQRTQTLYKTMYAIMQFQHDYFMTGDERRIKPMILKDIAEITGLDISTVSRVANSKYVQTEFGTRRLKDFFSESVTTTTGEEVSTLEVKNMLSEIVAKENKKKPLSDEKLKAMLEKAGYNIARRTVAKYREQLNIPVARLRKVL